MHDQYQTFGIILFRRHGQPSPLCKLDVRPAAETFSLLVNTVLRGATHGPPDRPLLQPLHPAAPVQLCKHEALELDGDPIDADGARHPGRELVAVAEELVAAGHFRTGPPRLAG